MADNLWKVLGISPTNNRRDIKRAYATKLKLIDIDADPESFVMLRESYEQATYLSDYAEYNDADKNLNIDDSEGINPHVDSSEIDSIDYDSRVNNVEDDQTSEIEDSGFDWQYGNDLYNAIADILIIDDQNNPEKQFLSNEEETQLANIAEQFFSWLEQSPILVSQAYEDNVAELITYSIPRSDAILGQAIEQFGWDSNGTDWDRNIAISELLNRYEGNKLLGEIMVESHPLYPAYEELCGGGPKSLLFSSAPKKQLKELLQITDNYPSVEAVFDSERLTQWKVQLKIGTYDDGSVESNWFGSLRLWIIVIIFLSVILSQCQEDTNKKLKVDTVYLKNADSDIDRILNPRYNETLSTEVLFNENPKFYLHLKSLWNESKEQKVTIEEFDQIVSKDIIIHYNDARYSTEIANQREFWDIYLARLNAIDINDAAACERFLTTEANVSDFPEELRERKYKLISKVLLSYQNFDEHNFELNRSTTIPSGVISEIIDKTGYSREIISDNFRGQGNYMHKCVFQKAMIETVLDSEQASELLGGI